MFRFALFAAVLPLCVFSDDNGKQPYRATVRHIESGGIGYEEGYTTFEAFVASDPNQWDYTPFLDVRGHVFDDGKWAANGGIGVRTLWGNRAYGINTYYDYRNAGHFHANQIGLGFETLGELWDFRINGYLPVGAKTSGPYKSVFGSFLGHRLLVKQKFQSAMKGADAEFGFHFGKSTSFEFYAAAGPYYFIGEMAPATWGGKARIGGIYKDMLTLEISDSYDRTFHNKFQGQIGLTFSFGPRSKGTACHALNDRMVQPVGRQEIIVVDNRSKDVIAIDPATGLPYFFVFVDNTGSSDGSYESPYHSFAQAQDNSSPHDIIYVFPGDGTAQGMNAGIALQANQKLWGSGVSHPIQTSVGTISIPAQSSAAPTITNTDINSADGNAIDLASNNAISGFTIVSALNDGIFGTDAQNLEVTFCTFENMTTFPIEATCLSDATLSITNNQFLNNFNGISLTLNGTSTVACSMNTFKGQNSPSEFPVEITTTDNSLAVLFTNNTFDNNFTGSILFKLTDVIDANISLQNNTLTHSDTGSKGLGLGSSFVIEPNGTVDHCAILLSGNTFSGNTSNSLYMNNSGAINALEVTASSNIMTDNGGSAFVLGTPVTNTLTFLATDNTMARLADNGIGVNAPGTTLSANLTVINNTITDIGNTHNAASGINIAQDFSTLNLTLLNNVINNCEGSGILSYASTGIDSFLLNIENNTISNCVNYMAQNAASAIDIEQFTDFSGSITNNTLTGNTDTAVIIGSTLVNPRVCLTLSGNQSTSYLLTNPLGGLFDLSPWCNQDALNTGTITTSGTINLGPLCPNATPCNP